MSENANDLAVAILLVLESNKWDNAIGMPVAILMVLESNTCQNMKFIWPLLSYWFLRVKMSRNENDLAVIILMVLEHIKWL